MLDVGGGPGKVREEETKKEPTASEMAAEANAKAKPAEGAYTIKEASERAGAAAVTAKAREAEVAAKAAKQAVPDYEASTDTEHDDILAALAEQRADEMGERGEAGGILGAIQDVEAKASGLTAALSWATGAAGGKTSEGEEARRAGQAEANRRERREYKWLPAVDAKQQETDSEYGL